MSRHDKTDDLRIGQYRTGLCLAITPSTPTPPSSKCNPACDSTYQKCAVMPNTDRYACQETNRTCEHNGKYYANGYELGSQEIQQENKACITNKYNYRTGYEYTSKTCSGNKWIYGGITLYNVESNLCKPEWLGCMQYQRPMNANDQKDFKELDCCQKVSGTDKYDAEIKALCES